MSPAESGATDNNGEVFLVVRTRSVFACLLHWILFFSVVTLTLTGLYIAYPSYIYGQGEAWQVSTMADIRTYHMYAALALTFAIFTRMYLAFTKSCNKDMKQFLPTPKNIIGALRLAKYFITFTGEHKHYRFVNPLGGVGIFTMSILFLVQIFTGLALYLHGANPDSWGWAMWVQPVAENLLGGQQGVRLVHHVAMYALAAVVIIHVYMQVWKASMFTESDMSSIISGYKIFPLSQIGHFDDVYGLRLDEPAPSDDEMEKESEVMIEAKYK